MNRWRRRRAGPWAALLVLAGCASDRAVAHEMNEQQAQIRQESRAWRGAIESWGKDNDSFERWHEAHEAHGKPDPAAGGLAAHQAKLAEHMLKVGVFTQELSAFDAKMNDLRGKPASYQLTSHAPLWAWYLKLKVTFDGLDADHKALSDEHAQRVADSTHVPN